MPAGNIRNMEMTNLRKMHILAIQAACRNHDVQVINFSGHRTGSPIAEKTHPVLFADVSDAVPTGRTLGCQTLMLLTNALNPDGSVADRFEEIPDGIKFKNTVTALRQLVSIVPDDITLVLEPLNTLVDHPSAIVREVGSARLKILCDLYHFGVMGADLKRIVTNQVTLQLLLSSIAFPSRRDAPAASAR